MWSTALKDTNSRSVQGRRENGIIRGNWIYLMELKTEIREVERRKIKENE